MKVKIYGKGQDLDEPPIEIINDVVEHYCTNGMFYVRTKRNEEYYFVLEIIGFISVEPESEVNADDGNEDIL